MTSMRKSAILALADGTIFRGVSIGADGYSLGEVVFNTSMTGYQEILTDPSYAKQIVTLTYPHIGNTGVNNLDTESGNTHKVWASGLVIRDLTLTTSSFRSNGSLSDYLKANNIIGIADIDTRKLTRILREKGAQNGCIMTADDNGICDEDKALELARSFAGIAGMDLAKVCCDTQGYIWTQGSWRLNKDGSEYFAQLDKDIQKQFNIVAYDFGVKTNILRMLVDRGCHVTVVPAQTPVEKVLSYHPDGIFLSNGPGDPAACDYAIDAVKKLIKTDIPVFGICLGHQLLALSVGANTVKMKFGHHGANHPVKDNQTGKVMITSQNHSFVVDESTLPDNIRITHSSLFDSSNQGLELTDRPVFSFQGHPEASPGPHDCSPLFDKFIDMMKAAKA